MPNGKKVLPFRQSQPEISESTRLTADDTLVYRIKMDGKNDYEFEAPNDTEALKGLANYVGISYPINRKEFNKSGAYGMWLIRPCWRKVFPPK